MLRLYLGLSDDSDGRDARSKITAEIEPSESTRPLELNSNLKEYG